MTQSGDRAPEFRLRRLGGRETSLAEIVAGAPALIAFFKTTCPVCQLMLPHLERIHASGRLPVFCVSQNDADSTAEFNREFGLSMPTLLDPEGRYPASNAYGIRHVPTVFLVERDGTVSQAVDGWSRPDVQALGEMAGVDPFEAGVYVPEFRAG
jgi:peroxiredoxin